MKFFRSSVKRLIERRSDFAAACGGLAAIEFALIAPVMVFLFLAVVEGSDALSSSRRVSQSVNTLTDLVAQETEITQAQLDDLYVGVEDIISLQTITVTFAVISVAYDAGADKIVVQWSRDSTGSQPYAPGTEYAGIADATLFDETSSLIVGEVSYDYTPGLSQILISNITFEKSATRWPRRAARVEYCVTPGNCTSGAVPYSG